jgi:hypothetical protein
MTAPVPGSAANPRKALVVIGCVVFLGTIAWIAMFSVSVSVEQRETHGTDRWRACGGRRRMFHVFCVTTSIAACWMINQRSARGPAKRQLRGVAMDANTRPITSSMLQPGPKPTCSDRTWRPREIQPI